MVIIPSMVIGAENEGIRFVHFPLAFLPLPLLAAV
jgi:hypothetical protein